MPLPEISLAVPMYNEEKGIDLFFERVCPVLESLGYSWEIVCVNDGSQDSTLEKLLEHHQRDPRIVVVDLSRNFGKEIALTAAIDHCKGRAVVPMDADLQDPPEILPELFAKWKEGYDMVIALARSRQADTAVKRVTASWFYKLFNEVATVIIPPEAGDFRLIDRRVVEALKRLPENNRFMKGLFAWVGFRYTTVEYDREGRAAGSSTFTYWQLWNFALNGIIAFSSIPLRIWSYIGIGVSSASILYGMCLAVRTWMFDVEAPAYAPLMVVMLFLGGLQLISLGVIGEYLSRIYEEAKRRPLYIVREVVQ